MGRGVQRRRMGVQALTVSFTVAFLPSALAEDPGTEGSPPAACTESSLRPIDFRVDAGACWLVVLGTYHLACKLVRWRGCATPW